MESTFHASKKFKNILFYTSQNLIIVASDSINEAALDCTNDFQMYLIK